MISGCKITQLKLNLHPINRSFFRNEAKRAEIRHAGADTGSAGADARRGLGAFPPAHLPPDPENTHRLHPRLDRQRALLVLLLHPQDVPHHPRQPRPGHQVPHPARPHTHLAAARGRNPPPRQLRLPLALLDRHGVDRRRVAALPRHQIRRDGRGRLRPADGRHLEAARRAGPHTLPRIGVLRRIAGIRPRQGENVVGDPGHLAHRPLGAAQRPYRRLQPAPDAPRAGVYPPPQGHRPGLRPRHAGLRHGRRRGGGRLLGGATAATDTWCC